MGVEHISKDMDVNDDISDNEEMKNKVHDPLFKSEGRFVLNPPTIYAYGSVDQKVSLPHVCTSTLANEASGCAISLAGSEPPSSSRCSAYDEGGTVKELRAEDISTGDLDPFPSGSGSENFHAGTALPQEKDWNRSNFGADSAKTSDMRGLQPFSSKVIDNNHNKNAEFVSDGGEKYMSRNRPPVGITQMRTVTPSGFSQFLLNKATKGKRTAHGELEACGRYDGLVMGQNNRKTCYRYDAKGSDTKTASNFLIQTNASDNQLSSHISDQSHTRSLHDGISLRQWLKSRHGTVTKLEKLQLFGKIVELVDFEHSQGVILQDLQASRFMLFSSKRVKYTGSLAAPEMECVHDLHENRPLEQDTTAFSSLGVKQRKLDVDMKSFRRPLQFSSFCAFRGNNVNGMDRHDTDGRDFIYSKQKGQNNCGYKISSVASQWKSVSPYIQLEKKWYTSPEELNNGVCTLSSNIYSLGVLLFELLCSFESWEVHSTAMLNLRHRILPPDFLSENPMEAAVCVWLLHPEPHSRPSTREILQAELLWGYKELSSGKDISRHGCDADVESELLLDFLGSLKEKMLNHTFKMKEEIELLEEDIREVEKRYLCTTSSIPPWTDKDFLDAGPLESALSRVSNGARLMGNIDQLKNAYFSMRSQIQLVASAAETRTDVDILKNLERASQGKTENEESRMTETSDDHLWCFFEGLCKFARYSRFQVCGTLRNGDLLNSSNVICSLSCSRDEDYIAAAGVSKKIKVFEFDALLDDSIDIHYPVTEMSNNSKLSCVCWNHYIKNYLASADYDGVVKVWDSCTGQRLSQYAEHQRRAWSVDFCQYDPIKFASGSDDCSAKLWSINEKNSVGTIWSPANVCSVKFSSYSTDLLLLGSADYKIYCYDLRHTQIPWCTLAGHKRTVSYVKFLDSETVISASTDNSLKLWDLTRTSSAGLSTAACQLTYSGHTNEKNFVGLSVMDGYIVCGSETNEVYGYHRSLPMPITSCKFGSANTFSGLETNDDNGQFISSVCWAVKSNMIVAANSCGGIKVLQMV